MCIRDSPKTAELLDRGAKIGDIVKVNTVGTSATGNTPIEVWSYIQDIVGDLIDPIINPAFGWASNQASIPATEVTDIQTNVSGEGVDLIVNEVGYDGFFFGGIEASYTLLITAGATELSGYDGARFRVISGDGSDDVSDVSVIPGGPTPVGTRGLTVEFESADLVAGQRFTISVQQEHEASVLISGGTLMGMSRLLM